MLRMFGFSKTTMTCLNHYGIKFMIGSSITTQIEASRPYQNSSCVVLKKESNLRAHHSTLKRPDSVTTERKLERGQTGRVEWSGPSIIRYATSRTAGMCHGRESLSHARWRRAVHGEAVTCDFFCLTARDGSLYRTIDPGVLRSEIFRGWRFCGWKKQHLVGFLES